MNIRDQVEIIRSGDLSEIQALIASGIDINSVADDVGDVRATFLREALNRNDGVIAQLLIDAGADINLSDSDGWTPLWCTVTDYNIPMTELLLRNGANLNYRDNTGETPLRSLVGMCDMRAYEGVAAKYDAMLNYLFDHGADINSRANDGSSILTDAVRWGCPTVLKHLLDNGAEVDVADEDGWTALMWAAVKGNIEAAGMLLANAADINRRDLKGSTPLILAAKGDKSDVAMVEYLLSQRADPDILDLEGESYQDWLDEQTIRVPLWPV